MFLERLNKKLSKLGFGPSQLFNSAIYFKIPEEVDDFTQATWKEFCHFRQDESSVLATSKFGTLPSKLPYERIVLDFNDYAIGWRQDDEKFQQRLRDSEEGGTLYHFDKAQSISESLENAFTLQVSPVRKSNLDIVMGHAYIFDSRTFELKRSLAVEPQVFGIHDLTDESHAMINDNGWGFLVMLVKFLNFLSCKNIQVVKRQTPQVARYFRKKGSPPPLQSYYTLQLQSSFWHAVGLRYRFANNCRIENGQPLSSFNWFQGEQSKSSSLSFT